VTERSCVVCPQLRVGSEPRPYDRPNVCDGCRSRLRSLLAEVLDCYAQLETYPGSGSGQKVSGTPERRLPLNTDALDLTMPPPLRHVHDELGDQTGHPGTAAVLDSWARDWQSYRPTWEHLPLPTVSSLVGWLTDRLDWACDVHPAIDDFGDEIRATAAVLRSAAGLNRPPVEHKAGVPCRECETVALYRWPGSEWIECGNCPSMLSQEEYERWTQLLAAPEHQPWVEEIARRSVA